MNFLHTAAVVAMAVGVPLAGAAALAGLPQPAFANYLIHALRGGGYFSDHAASIYRLRYNPVPPNFLLLALLGGSVRPADCVLVHFHHTTLVSKNLKELSFNANLAPGVGGAVYLTIKTMIDNQFVAAGSPTPSSATVVSADLLQPE